MDAIRVLLVDDNPTFLRSARKALRAMDRVTVIGAANSGAEALALAQSRRPDLVLMDIRMPGMNGIETARRLRALDTPCKIIFMSQLEYADTVVAQSNVVVDGIVGKSDFALETAPLIKRLFPCAARVAISAARTVLMRLLAPPGTSTHSQAALPYWVWSMDADLRFDDVRGPHAAIAGLTCPAYLHHRLWDLPAMKPLDGDWAPLKACMTNRTSFADMLLQRIHCGGQTQYCAISGTPLFDDAGIFIGYLGTLRDAALEYLGTAPIAAPHRRTATVQPLDGA